MASETNYFVGKHGKALVGSTDCNVEGWSVDHDADRIDVTSTRTAGYRGVITGVQGSTFTLTLSWDAAANPLDSPPALKAGTTLSTVKLYLNTVTSPYWSYPTAKVLKTSNESKVDTKTTITVSCEADGTFTPPTGNFTPAA
jgi:hypothetical protein